MDRLMVYPGAIPLDTDVLNSQKNAYYGLGWLTQALLGTGTAIAGLQVAPTSPATLQVTVAPGAIFALATVDASAFGSLGTDANQVVKEGIAPTVQTLTLTAPTTTGFSTNYLVQVGFSEVDDTPVTLPYFNASNPSVAWLGPENSGSPQNTRRHDNCVVSLKAGTPAATGSQTTPAPDAGFTGIFVITVANGQTQITSGNISQLAAAPFLPVTLPGVPPGVLGNAWSYGADTGAVNALAVTLSPIPAAYKAGMEVLVRAANTNTGAATLNVNGLGVVPIVHKDGGALGSGDIVGGQVVIVVYDGANFQLQAAAGTSQFVIPFANDTGAANALVATFSPAIGAYTAGLLLEVKVAATNTGATTINVNGLGTKTIKTSTGADLSASAIAAGQVIFVVYDGTNFQLGLTLSGLSNAVPYVADTGSVNTLVANYSPAIGSLSPGLMVQVKIANNNTGAATLNVNGLGTTTITRSGGSALQAGDLAAGQIGVFIFDGTNFQSALTPARIDEVGDVRTFLRVALPAGYVEPNGGTIGSAASGGTIRANADTFPLFAQMWNLDPTVSAVQTSTGSASSRGASAVADFAANCRIVVPEMRGIFIRTLDDGRGIDTGRLLGSAQTDAYLNHGHGVNDSGHAHTSTLNGSTPAELWSSGGGAPEAITLVSANAIIGQLTINPAATGVTVQTSTTGSTETRPKNIALLVGIKL